MSAEKLFPRCFSAPLGRRFDAVLFQNISNRFVCQHMAQIGQCSLDAAVTPASILLGHANDQRCNLGRGLRSSWRSNKLPSYFFAISFRCQANSVSGVTIVAT